MKGGEKSITNYRIDIYRPLLLSLTRRNLLSAWGMSAIFYRQKLPFLCGTSEFVELCNSTAKHFSPAADDVLCREFMTRNDESRKSHQRHQQNTHTHTFFNYDWTCENLPGFMFDLISSSFELLKLLSTDEINFQFGWQTKTQFSLSEKVFRSM
jgi:hypothetical protein